MKNTEIISISLPKGYGKIIDQRAKSYYVTRSKYIELVLKGIIDITRDKNKAPETK